MAIDKTKLTGVEKVYPLNVSPYEQYMGDFQNPSVVSKINAMIQSLHQIGRLTNETVSQWNNVMKWIVEGGMDEIAETVTNEKVSVALEEVMRMLDVSLDNGLKELAEKVSGDKIDELVKTGDFEEMVKTSVDKIYSIVTDKISGFEIELRNKIEKGSVSVYDIDKNMGKLDETFMTDKFISQITGNTPISGSLPKSSIDLDKMSWMSVVNLNLHDKTKDTPSTTINALNGEVLSDVTNTWKTSEFMPVEEEKFMSNSNTLSGAMYDENKVFLSGLVAGHSKPYKTVKNAKWVKHTYRMDESGVLCEGSTLIKTDATFGEKKTTLVSNDMKKIISDVSNEMLKIIGKKVDVSNLLFFDTKNLNLHNHLTDTLNAYLQGGKVVNVSESNANYNKWKVSALIPVIEGQTLTTQSTLYSAYYNKDGVYVSDIPLTTSRTYTVPSGVAWVRHGFDMSSNGVLSEGNLLADSNTPYNQTQISINNEDVKKALRTNNVLTEGATTFVFGDSISKTDNVSEDGLTRTKVKSSWVTHTAKDLMLGTVLNFAQDGAAFRDRENLTFYQKLSNQITVALSLGITPKINVVSCGTNDGTSFLGDYDTAMLKPTLQDLDRTNLYEAIRWAFWTLKKTFPDTTHYAGLPIQRADRTIEQVKPMVDAIRKMAKVYGFIVVDAEAESGIVKELEVPNGQGMFLSDGLHPNNLGVPKLSKVYTRVIKNTYNG